MGPGLHVDPHVPVGRELGRVGRGHAREAGDDLLHLVLVDDLQTHVASLQPGDHGQGLQTAGLDVGEVLVQEVHAAAAGHRRPCHAHHDAVQLLLRHLAGVGRGRKEGRLAAGRDRPVPGRGQLPAGAPVASRGAPAGAWRCGLCAAHPAAAGVGVAVGVGVGVGAAGSAVAVADGGAGLVGATDGGGVGQRGGDEGRVRTMAGAWQSRVGQAVG